MVASLDEIESLISKAKQDDTLRNAIKDVEKRTFANEVGLYDFLFVVVKMYASHLYFWQVKMPTRSIIRNKLGRMIKATNELIEEYRKPDEMIVLENELGKTDFFSSKRNFSLRQRELEQDLMIYNYLLERIPSTGGGRNPKPSYKDIIQLLIPFYRKYKTNFSQTRKHGDTNIYLGDDTKFVIAVMPLLNKIYLPIKLVKDSSIGDYIRKMKT